MVNIDQYAHSSFLRDIHPGEKFLFACLTMLLVLILNSLSVSILVTVSVSVIIVRVAGVSGKFLFKLMLLPLGFLIIGCGVVAVNITTVPLEYIASFKIGAYWIGVTKHSLYYTINLFMRAIASVTCLYFLALSTPITQIIYVLRRLKIPEIIVDLMVLIYGNIFVVFRTAGKIYISQLSRGGYNSFMNRLRSLSCLCSSLLVKCMYRTEKSYNSLLARGFTGKLNFIEEAFEFRKSNFALIFIHTGVIVSVYFIGG